MQADFFLGEWHYCTSISSISKDAFDRLFVFILQNAPLTRRKHNLDVNLNDLKHKVTVRLLKTIIKRHGHGKPGILVFFLFFFSYKIIILLYFFFNQNITLSHTVMTLFF